MPVKSRDGAIKQSNSIQGFVSVRIQLRQEPNAKIIRSRAGNSILEHTTQELLQVPRPMDRVSTRDSQASNH